MLSMFALRYYLVTLLARSFTLKVIQGRKLQKPDTIKGKQPRHVAQSLWEVIISELYMYFTQCLYSGMQTVSYMFWFKHILFGKQVQNTEEDFNRKAYNRIPTKMTGTENRELIVPT